MIIPIISNTCVNHRSYILYSRFEADGTGSRREYNAHEPLLKLCLKERWPTGPQFIEETNIPERHAAPVGSAKGRPLAVARIQEKGAVDILVRAGGRAAASRRITAIAVFEHLRVFRFLSTSRTCLSRTCELIAQCSQDHARLTMMHGELQEAEQSKRESSAGSEKTGLGQINSTAHILPSTSAVPSSKSISKSLEEIAIAIFSSKVQLLDKSTTSSTEQSSTLRSKAAANSH